MPLILHWTGPGGWWRRAFTRCGAAAGVLACLLLLSETKKNSETKDAPLAATVRKGREEGKREREKQKAASTTSGAQKREKKIARPLRGEGCVPPTQSFFLGVVSPEI